MQEIKNFKFGDEKYKRRLEEKIKLFSTKDHEHVAQHNIMINAISHELKDAVKEQKAFNKKNKLK